MRSVLRTALAVALVSLAGCCQTNKFAADSLAAAWDDGPASIKPYAVAGVEADPSLRDDPALAEADRVARKEAKARRLRTIEEFGALIKELQTNAAQ